MTTAPHEVACMCTEQQRMTVCHDIRTEPHLVGCPRWGTRKKVVRIHMTYPDGTHTTDCEGCKPMTAAPTDSVSATPPGQGEDWSNPTPEQIAACSAYNPDPEQYGTAAPTGPEPRTDAAVGG